MPSQLRGAMLRPVLSLSLAFLLGLPQGITPAAAQAQPAPAKLNIVIVGGEGAINNIRQRTAREPIVQVEDENHRPVAGAVVLFLLPDNGPSGFKVNRVEGKFQIQVQATYQGVSASATIAQVNAAPAVGARHGMSGRTIAILSAVGAAAAVGIVLAVRRGSGSTTISPGTPTVGAPQ